MKKRDTLIIMYFAPWLRSHLIIIVFFKPCFRSEMLIVRFLFFIADQGRVKFFVEHEFEVSAPISISRLFILYQGTHLLCSGQASTF